MGSWLLKEKLEQNSVSDSDAVALYGEEVLGVSEGSALGASLGSVTSKENSIHDDTDFFDGVVKNAIARTEREEIDVKDGVVEVEISGPLGGERADEEGKGRELFDSAALTVLRKAASSFTSVNHIVGGEELETNLSDEEKEKLEKIQLIRVKFLRIVHRLGRSIDDSMTAPVLRRMVLAAGKQCRAFSLETARGKAMELEAKGKDDIDFSLNILVLGKTGVGKSATINSIFGEERATISAFGPGTTAVKEIVGTVGGVKIRVFDTPGLKSSDMEQTFNRKMLSSVKKFTKKYPPDILLYVDRLDSHETRDLNDMPLLRSITDTLGSSIWKNAVIALTHAASAPPDGPSGYPLSYDTFVDQRSQIVQQSIGQAVGDLRMVFPIMMNPVSLVENHNACRRNREGQKVLPNGLVWQPELLFVCYSMKILSEVNSLAKPQHSVDHSKLFGFRVHAPPLPYLLSLLMQSRIHPKLPTDQSVDNADSDIDLEELVGEEIDEEEDEYDQLPPFKPLKKSQIAMLSKDMRKAYLDEYDHRVKLFQKKQWKEELRRMRASKKRGKDYLDDYGNMGEDTDQENAPTTISSPLPDMVLPPSFNGDNLAYRYQALEPTLYFLSRPVLDTLWDCHCGFDGVILEKNLVIAGRFPAGVAAQIHKDKNEFKLHLVSSTAVKHGENGSALAAFDIQPVGEQLAYILRGETKFKMLKRNKMTGGVAVIFIGENVATGLKLEDRISIGRRVTLVGSTGTIKCQNDMAYVVNLEARLKEKDYPVGQEESTLGLCLMKSRGDLAARANLQSHFSIGRSTKTALGISLDKKLHGKVTLRTSSSGKLQIALVGILPIAVSIFRSIWPKASESNSAY